MQDIVVYISLDTAAQEKPTLLPLILSFEGESAYKEYSSAEAVAVDFPASSSLTALAARALFDQVKLESCPGRIKKVAVYGVASDAQPSAVTAALDTLRETQDEWYFLLPTAANTAMISALSAWCSGTVLSLAQLEAGQVERAIAYLEQLDRSLQTVDTLLKTGNVTVDAILSAKLAQARAAGIAVTAEANLPPELSLTDLELSIVIGNLLDNAIEGCRSAAGEKFLRLSLRMKGDMLYFYLLNSAGKKQKKVGSLFRTGKTGAHGFGLHRAEAIVKQHGGWVKYNSEDGAFTSEFLVPAAC